MIIDTTNDELLINGQRWQRGGYLLATAYSTDQINITARDGRVIGKAIEWDRILDKDKNTFGLDRDGTVTALTNIFNSQVKSPYKVDALRDVENGTAAYGEVMIYRSPGEWQYEVLEQYHGAYDSEAATLRSGATATLELYYTAQADGDGISELSQSNTPTSGYKIIRKLYYSERAQQDPDTGTWVQFADVAANTSFNDAKTSLLAYLKERTGGTVPISLKMTWEEVELLLLEEYPGAAAAYSLRLLDNTYTGSAIRVRRASDNAEQDIGFDANGDLDTSALDTFCSGTDGFVKTWYDQANGNDATQTTTSDQPNIYYFTYDNALLQSNQFDTTWDDILGGGTITDGQSGYDGSNDAWLLEKGATTYRRIQQNVSMSGVWTMSAYLKAGTATVSRFRFNSASYMVEFNFSSGVATDQGSVSAIDFGMTDVGNGWYRCYATFNASVSIAQIYVDWTDSTASTLYIQDAQIETGDTLTDYVETTTTVATTGHVVTENGKPALQFDGTNDELNVGSYPFTQSDIYIASVAKHTETTAEGNVYNFSDASTIHSLGFNRNAGSTYGATRFLSSSDLQGDSYDQTQSLFSQVYASSTLSAYRNAVQGTQSYNSRVAFNTNAIGSRGGLYFLNGNIQEVVVYDSDQSTNRTGIETDINDYYSIYP